MTATAQLTSNWKSYQLSEPEIEFDEMEEMYPALRMHLCEEKTILLGKYDLFTVALILHHFCCSYCDFIVVLLTLCDFVCELH